MMTLVFWIIKASKSGIGFIQYIYKWNKVFEKEPLYSDVISLSFTNQLYPYWQNNSGPLKKYDFADDKLHEHENIRISTQKMKFSSKDFFSNGDQIRSCLWTWLYLLKKSMKENLIFCVVYANWMRLVSSNNNNKERKKWTTHCGRNSVSIDIEGSFSEKPRRSLNNFWDVRFLKF